MLNVKINMGNAKKRGVKGIMESTCAATASENRRGRLGGVGLHARTAFFSSFSLELQ